MRMLRKFPGSDAKMTIVDHLGELRRRLVISIIALAVGAIVVFLLYDRVLDFLVGPYTSITRGTGRCGKAGCKLIVTDPIEGFMVRLKVATYGGIVLSLPVVLYQVWRFVTPGLNPKERRYAIPFVLSSMVLFLFGGFVAWVTFPKALDFLVKIGGGNVETFYAAGKYLSLISLMIVAFGAAFEFPILLVFLLLAGIISTSQLRRARRYAIVGITVAAAVITPSQDPYSLFFMAIPMYVFYEISILIGRWMKR
jgi:sec-independent protein translocase protein TatC